VEGLVRPTLLASHPGFTFERQAATCAAMTMDMFWSWFAMPIGLTICFWPFLIAWYAAERKGSDADSEKN
jgi:hypothetical protein